MECAPWGDLLREVMRTQASKQEREGGGGEGEGGRGREGVGGGRGREREGEGGRERRALFVPNGTSYISLISQSRVGAHPTTSILIAHVKQGS